MDTMTILKSQAELFKKLNPLDSAVMIIDVERTVLQYVKGEKFDLNIAINSISSNTNLLGLNAAIEAARAGEHER